MAIAGVNYFQTAQTASESANQQAVPVHLEVKRRMSESSPQGPALFVDQMEECCSSLVCEGLQGHQAKPDEKEMQKPCLTPARGQGWKNICIIQEHSWISKLAAGTRK